MIWHLKAVVAICVDIFLYFQTLMNAFFLLVEMVVVLTRQDLLCVIV